MLFSALPHAQGLYDPERESDSCGVAMITDIQGRRSHAIVADGLVALEHLEHRGAAAPKPTAVTARAFSSSCRSSSSATSSTSTYPRRPPTAATRSRPESASCRRTWPSGRPRASRSRPSRTRKGCEVLGWREVPVDPDGRRSRRDRAGLHAVHGADLRRGTRSSRRHRPRPSGLPAAQEGRGGQTSTSRRCPAGPSPTRAC